MAVVERSDSGPIRVLTLNRPEKLNAFNAESYRMLAGLLGEADADEAVKVCVLCGAGRAFSSGVDLAAFSSDSGSGGSLSETFKEMIDALGEFSKPLVAGVHGVAVGIGVTILLHCDVVVMADDTRVRFPFTTLGTAPEAASSVLLPAAVGSQRAAELLLTSRWLTGTEAALMGLAAKSCAPDLVEQETLAVAGSMAEHHVESLISAKRLLRAGRKDAVDAAITREFEEAGRLSSALGGFASRS